MTDLYRLSSIHHWHSAHDARFRIEAGWKEVDNYGNTDAEIASALQSVGVCDVSSMTKIDIQGDDLMKFLEAVLEMRLSHPQLSTTDLANADPWPPPLRVLRLQKERVLLLEPPHRRETRLRQLSNAAISFHCAHVSDLTSAYAAVRVVGPRSFDLLKKLCSGNLEASTSSADCIQAPFAKVAAMVIRADIGGTKGFLVLVSRDYGEYVWNCIMSAGNEYHIRPFGAAAEKLISGKEQKDVATI